MLRTRLRQIPWLYRLNAAIKARQTVAEYRSLRNRYAAVGHAAPPLPLLREATAGKRPNIFFLGTDEQQDRGGTLQALQSLGSVRFFTRADGSYGQNDPRPEALRRRANAERLWELVSQQAAANAPPHILVAQTWATLIDPEVFDRIRAQFGTLVVNIAMDDRHQFRGHRLGEGWSGTLGLIGHIDLALTAAPECVNWYHREGCPALYFPEASDPDIFHPMPDLPKLHDVSFVGACYGVRKEIVTALRSAGIRVAAYGSGWDNGRIATDDVPRLFAQSRIVLGVGTIGHCRDFHALKMRDFDGPMSGSLYLTHANPDLDDLFDVGRELATYASIEECIARVRLYLADDPLREQVAASGRRRAVRDHTWQRRFGDLFKQLGAAAWAAPAGSPPAS